MTIPKKGRRTIVVDDVAFHYKVSVERAERIVIQLATGSGVCLFILPHSIMKPSHIADATRFALSRGCLPGENSDDCWLAFDAGSKGGSLLEFIPNDDFRVVTYATCGRLNADLDSTKCADRRRWYERPIKPDN
ncbi:hypothetical protein C5Y93_12670 [Blastopirellula marina]|uniref:Uncharacterized protein n=1 Tax=Blastopirellula marina TaxID=124 RepID=A0A2S8GP41_9BACT|nr:hypothetical protein C5Y93_12670 [Blastopirellula marina]